MAQVWQGTYCDYPNCPVNGPHVHGTVEATPDQYYPSTFLAVEDEESTNEHTDR